MELEYQATRAHSSCSSTRRAAERVLTLVVENHVSPLRALRCRAGVQHLEVAALCAQETVPEGRVLGGGCGAAVITDDSPSLSDLDGALLSGPDCDRSVNANVLAEASLGQDGGDAGRHSRTCCQ